MAVNIGPRIGIDGETEYREKINKIIQQTKTLKSEYEKLSSSMDKGKTTLKQNAEQHEILTKQIDKQKERVKELASMVDESTKKFGESDTRTQKWKQALNEAETELNQLQTQLKELPSDLQIVGDRMKEMGDKIQSMGSSIKNMGNALRPLSTAATAVIAGSVKTFMDFESQMSRVKAISGATGDEFDTLTQKARDMGASTKFTATEAGEAFEYMAMAGWKSQQMLDGIAPVMNLAAASGEELGTVSDIVTDALTAFGLQAQDAAHFTDVLAATATNANTNVGMMGESFKYAAPMAGSLGYSVEDVSLALGLMANNGIKADMAGTALRNMLQRMAKPTKESAAAMDRLGVYLENDEGEMQSLRDILDQLRDSFGDINLPIESFNNIMESLNEQLEDGTLTESKYIDKVSELAKQAYGAEASEKARAAAMLAGARAMPALLSIVNTSEQEYRKLASSIDNSAGAAQNMADIMLDNTAGAVTVMKSALEGAGIELGEVFAPYVTKAAEKVQDLAVRFSKLSQSEQENIAKQVAFVAAAAPTLKIIGGMTEGVGKLVSTGGQFVSWLGSLGPAAGPAALAVAGLGAITAGVIGVQKALDNMNTESINKALSKAFKNEDGVPVEQLFQNVSDKITEMSGTFETVSQKSAALDQAKTNVSNLVFEIDKISTSLETGVMTAEEAAPQLEKLLGQLADAVSVKMSAAADVLLATFADGGIVAQSFEAAGGSAEQMRDRIVESMDVQQRKVYELQEKMASVDYGSKQWQEAYEELVKLGSGTDDFERTVTQFSDYMANNPLDWSKYFNGDTFDVDSFQRDLQGLQDKTEEFKTQMQTSMDEAYAAVDQLNSPGLSASVREALPQAFSYAVGEMSSISTDAVDAIQTELIGGIDDVIRQAEEDWEKKSFLEKLFVWDNNQASFVRSQVDKYKTDFIDPLSDTIETNMEQLGVEGAGWASDAAGEIADGLFNIPTKAEAAEGAKTTLKSNWEEIFEDVTSAVKGVAEDRAKDVIDGFNSGISNNAEQSEEAAKSWMQKFKDAIHNSVMKFGSPSATARDFGKNTIDGFNEGVSQNQESSTTTVNTWMTAIQDAVSKKVPDVVDNFTQMKDDISEQMNSAKDLIQSAMDKIKAIFDTKLEFPQIKLPHFKIDGEFNLKSVPPKVPSINIDWYAKAMNSGMRLDGATIFGAVGDKLLGGGEAGKEWIIGENSLLSMIQSAVTSAISATANTVNIGDTTIVINSENGDPEEIAAQVDEIITARYQQMEAAWR